ASWSWASQLSSFRHVFPVAFISSSTVLRQVLGIGHRPSPSSFYLVVPTSNTGTDDMGT
ncbi:hypothetical protein BaRGS_00040554, partial [Batillaria attramentaria]